MHIASARKTRLPHASLGLDGPAVDGSSATAGGDRVSAAVCGGVDSRAMTVGVDGALADDGDAALPALPVGGLTAFEDVTLDGSFAGPATAPGAA